MINITYTKQHTKQWTGPQVKMALFILEPLFCLTFYQMILLRVSLIRDHCIKQETMFTTMLLTLLVPISTVYMNTHWYENEINICITITRLLGRPQPQMYPPVTLNQYTWVNRTHKHFLYMLQGPKKILK